jgi:predicted metalloprotease with PDZ domain
VAISTEADWVIATGMPAASSPRTYTASNYHDLVDMPFLVGHLDVDSLQVGGKWARLATYPAGMFTGATRSQFWDQIERILPQQARVMGDTPYDTYTTLMVFDSSYGGGSALEHQNSHLGIYTPFIIGNPLLTSITAHEFFHLWNVKRMRPAEMVPYRYDRAQPTPWLWVSEGITDYYADLSMVRAGVMDSAGFMRVTSGKIENVAGLPPTALEDASLSTWIEPTDGTQYVYYDKGSLAGFLLDIMIRDASDNRASLDDVMRQVYGATYKSGRGFTASDWWGAVAHAMGSDRGLAAFNSRYVDGREPYPWATTLPLAGFRLRVDSIREPRIGVFTSADSSGAVLVNELEAGGAAEEAGLKVGDQLIQVGEIPVNDATFGARFRQRYARVEGEAVPVMIRRNDQPMTLSMKVRTTVRVEQSIVTDLNASPKALRIRRGILTGTTGQ